MVFFLAQRYQQRRLFFSVTCTILTINSVFSMACFSFLYRYSFSSLKKKSMQTAAYSPGHMTITWQSHDSHMMVTQWPHDSHMMVTWWPHDSHMMVTWWSHDHPQEPCKLLKWELAWVETKLTFSISLGCILFWELSVWVRLGLPHVSPSSLSESAVRGSGEKGEFRSAQWEATPCIIPVPIPSLSYSSPILHSTPSLSPSPHPSPIPVLF